jgi:hypothetical protein
MLRMGLLCFGLAVGDLFGQAAGATATGGRESAVGASEAVAEYRLASGRLFVPRGSRPVSNRVDLLVHFHGHPPVVRDNFLASGTAGALAVLNYPGLSAAYAKPFKDEAQFGGVLTDAQERLAAHFGQRIELGRLALSSFSAGYGAVREILKQPQHAAKITGLVLTDSLYAGYATVDGKKAPDPEHLRDFVRFAQRAASNQVTMIVTHSQLVPGSYASTVETAAALIKAVGTARSPASGADATGMKLESRADKGNFHVLSYQGTAGEDHVNHLWRMHAALRLLAGPAGVEKSGQGSR